MAKLIYSAIMSLDGYVADEAGAFDWSAPDDEVHAFVNDQERQIGTYLYGRCMYEVMVAWETMPTTGEPPVIADYTQIWRAAEKIVYSSTLEAVTSARTRLENVFEPAAIQRLKAEADRDISIGGPHLAAEALRAGLVDECHFFVSPVVVGAGNRALPDTLQAPLELVDEHRFGNGVVHLHYKIANGMRALAY